MHPSSVAFSSREAPYVISPQGLSIVIVMLLASDHHLAINERTKSFFQSKQSLLREFETVHLRMRKRRAFELPYLLSWPVKGGHNR
jgi:hypothetical protein